MAPLSDDCFSTGGTPLRVEDGLALIAARVGPAVGTEVVGLADADGRVLGGDLVAAIDLPSFDNSAVDGWAVRHADLALAAETRLVADPGRAAAGGGAIAPLPEGRARRIFTGARLPAGADTVFMQEDVETAFGHVTLPPGLAFGANRRSRGEDVAAGQLALPRGRRLRPQDVALAAALGNAQLAVRRRLKVALLSTGDELVAAGAELQAGRIHDSNRPLLAAMVRRLGAEVSDLGIHADEGAALGTTLAAAAGHHLVLTSGGVSVGEEDHTRRAIATAGRLMLWRLAIKPGRPVTMGMIGGTPVVGLPGNPVAAFVTFVHVVRPLLAALSGERYAPPSPIPVPVLFAHAKRAGRREYLRVSLVRGEDGRVALRKSATEGAAMLSSLTGTNGLAELAEDTTRIEPGMTAGYFGYADLL